MDDLKGIDLINSVANKSGYKVITNTTLKANEKYHLVCPNGHDYHVTRRRFTQGTRCRVCQGLVKSAESYGPEFKKYGYQVLSYVNRKIAIKCSKCKDIKSGNAASFLRRLRKDVKCKNCKVWTKLRVQNLVEVDGFKTLSDFEQVKRKQKLKLLCPHQNTIFISVDLWLRGTRCQCNTRTIKWNVNTISYFCERNQHTLISDHYCHSEKLKFKCNFKHTFQMKWYSFKANPVCPVCREKKRIEEKQTILKSSVESEGFQLLSEYKDSFAPITIICSKNHKFDSNWSRWMHDGNRCPDCNISKKLNHEEVEDKFNKNGYRLLTKYKNWETKMVVICPVRHEWTTHWNNFQQGARCLYCSTVKPVQKDAFIEKIETAGYRPIKMVNKCKDKSLIKCPHGHEFKTNWDSFSTAGNRCPICSIYMPKTINQLNKILPKNFKAIDVKFGMYGKDKRRFFLIKCDKGHESWKVSKESIIRGCKNCNISKKQTELTECIKSLGLKVLLNDKSIIAPKELDIYIDDFKLAIEYHGTYWHSEKFKDKNYHLEKLKACKEKNIQLIQIFEDEWLERKEQVKNFIESKLGVNKKIFARKCKFESIKSSLARSFQNLYHIQGSAVSSFYFGLFHNDELVQVMSFGKHHRQNSKDMLLSRLCTKRGLQITGGASKLLKNAMKMMQINSVSTFADLRYSEGKVYQALGFKEVSKLKPDYSYVKNNKRSSKQSLRKTIEERKSNKTEKELRKEQGYLRIYDCGKIKYTLKKG